MLASAVRRLRPRAAREDSEVSSDTEVRPRHLDQDRDQRQQHEQGADAGGDEHPARGARRAAAAGSSGSAETGIAEHLLARGAGDVGVELPREVLLLARGQAAIG